MHFALIEVRYSTEMVLEIGQRVYHFRATEIAPGITAMRVRYGKVVEISRLLDNTQIVTIEAEDEEDEEGNPRRLTYPAVGLFPVT
jgi:hypothetical protein